MELFKSMLHDAFALQGKIQSAILDHWICLDKLKNDPNNTSILDRMQKIQLHIISLDKLQKQVLQQLRNEVEPFKGVKVSEVAQMLGLVNNNHIARRHSADAERINGHAPRSRASPKSDYEDVVRNGDVDVTSLPVRQNHSARNNRGASSPEPNSGDDEVQELTALPLSPVPEEDPNKAFEHDQTGFLGRLGLITNDQLVELQKKRSERKRRSTASSHFVYTNWEQPQKRKKHAYLQSLGSAPQTRQTTAKLNGPSPPPAKSNSSSRSTSSLSSSSKSAACARTSASKSTNPPASATKPGPLRNGEISVRQQHRDFLKLMKKLEGGDEPEIINVQPSQSLLKTQQQGKMLHLPGLPTGLTIERIENDSSDSSVCIVCKNPGSFTVCEYCSAKFHISCHNVSPASPYFCPKCVSFFRSQGIYSTDWDNLRLEMKSIKPEIDAATAKLAARAARRAVSAGVAHGRVGDQERSIFGPGRVRGSAQSRKRLAAAAAALRINQLPSSTTVIPIDGAAPVVLSVAPKKSTSARKSIAGAGPMSHFGYQLSDNWQQPQLQQSHRQASILLNHLSKPSFDAKLYRQRENLINQMGREALKRRRLAETKKSITKHAVSLLDPELLKRNAAKKMKQNKLGTDNFNNSDCVTVEVSSNGEKGSDRIRTSKENSPDCVYIPESPPRVPDVIDLESPKNEEEQIEKRIKIQRVKGVQQSDQQEPEVLNVSSGSSNSPSTGSPKRVSDSGVEPEKSVCSHDKSKEKGVGTVGVADVDVTDAKYLDFIFPGKYGYKINIVMIDSSSSRSSSPVMNWSASHSDDDVTVENDSTAASQVDDATNTADVRVPDGKFSELLKQDAILTSADDT